MMRGWWIVGIWAGFCAALLCLVWTAAFGVALDPMWAWFCKNKDAAGLQKLAKALNSAEVKAFINDKYKGAVVPAF